jgi:hypothetical protein
MAFSSIFARVLSIPAIHSFTVVHITDQAALLWIGHQRVCQHLLK